MLWFVVVHLCLEPFQHSQVILNQSVAKVEQFFSVDAQMLAYTNSISPKMCEQGEVEVSNQNRQKFRVGKLCGIESKIDTFFFWNTFV